jgi:hypothetical protein
MKPIHRLRDEHGIAMITAILVSGVILTLSITAASLSIHNSNSSGNDRQRTQVIAAAEAGLDAVMSSLSTTPTASLPCNVQGLLSSSPTQQYSVAVTYYDASNALAACSDPANTNPPTRAVLTSSGSSQPSGVAPAAKRTVQSEVVLHPVGGSFGAATIFSDQTPISSNAVQVNGDGTGDNANVYSNGSWACQNSMVVHGTLMAQANITMANSCQVTRDVWANGSVTMTGASLAGHNVTSSTSSISVSNTGHVLNNATAGTTITTSGAGAIDGTKTQNKVSPAPTVQTLPTVTFDASVWTAAGWTVLNQTCAQVAAVQTVTTKTVYRISPSCALTWSNASTISISADTAIVSDGSIAMANATTWNSGDGNKHLLMFIQPTASTCPATSFTTTNSTSFSSKLQVFVYTPCTATFRNSTAIGGQVYAGTVDIENAFSFNFSAATVPGAGAVTGYNVDIAYIREVVNP